MNLKPSSTRQSAIIPKWIPLAFLITSFLGFADATYLTANHYFGTPLVCSLIKGCEKVTSSPYSVAAGVPVALLGAAYYIFIFFLSILYLDTKKEEIINFIARFTAVGFLASLWFLYLQIFVIKAICLYCIFSLLTSTALFILGLMVIKNKKEEISSPL